jgi:predicted  nucleic acid-binding Zn-ribbon protein
MKVEISNGELLDKFSILEIKMGNISDPSKLTNVEKEYRELTNDCTDLLRDLSISTLYSELKSINQELWQVEDDIRECERRKDFGDEFISLARKVYFTNDERARVKKEINLASGSSLVEEKSYQAY